MENDFIDNDEEILLKLGSTLLEVKATRTNHAKMTPLQAETACREGERFALCVVEVLDSEPTLESVRQNSRFLFDIGAQLLPVWQGYLSIQNSADAARQHNGAIALDITEGQYRFRVDQTLWEIGLPFEKAVGVFLTRR